MVEIEPNQVIPKIENTRTIDRNRGRRFPSKHIGTSRDVSDLNGDHWVQMKPNVFQSVSLSTFYTPGRVYFQIQSPEYVSLLSNKTPRSFLSPTVCVSEYTHCTIASMSSFQKIPII